MPKLIINSIDSFGEKISQKMIAQKNVIDDISIYKYNNKYGKGEIRISPHFAEIFKFDDIQSKLLIKPNSETDFIYNASYFTKNFKVFCKKFLYSENKLTIAYTIYDNNVEINQLEIEIIEVQ